MFLRTRNVLCLPLFILLFAPFHSYGQHTRETSVLDYFPKKSDAITYSVFKGQPAPPKGLLILLGHQARWDEMGRGDLSVQGPHLRFEKVDGPATQGGAGAARYRVFASGVPENKVFAFGLWSVSNKFLLDPSNVYSKEFAPGGGDIYANEQGLLMTRRPKPDEETSYRAADELEVAPITEFAEPMRYLLESKDGDLQVFGTLVPHPALADDKGCRIEARIAQPASTALLIIMDGFPAKAKIPLVLESEGEIANDLLIADANGHAVTADFPYVAGKTRGVLKATAEGKECLPAVEVPWGPAVPAGAKAP
ncbi:MAG: hypothetical protein ABSG51_03740 [Terracidiphilus sp.]|jgi:hypothetical protein